MTTAGLGFCCSLRMNGKARTSRMEYSIAMLALNPKCVLGLHTVGQEHHNAINSASPSSCGWQTILQGVYEYLVKYLYLVVAFCLLFCLLHEGFNVLSAVVSRGQNHATYRFAKSCCSSRYRHWQFPFWQQNIQSAHWFQSITCHKFTSPGSLTKAQARSYDT